MEKLFDRSNDNSHQIRHTHKRRKEKRILIRKYHDTALSRSAQFLLLLQQIDWCKKKRGNTKTKNDIHIQEIIEDEENTNTVLFYTRLLHITSTVSQQLESKCSIPFSFIYLRKIDLLWI